MKKRSATGIVPSSSQFDDLAPKNVVFFLSKLTDRFLKGY